MSVPTAVVLFVVATAVVAVVGPRLAAVTGAGATSSPELVAMLALYVGLAVLLVAAPPAAGG